MKTIIILLAFGLLLGIAVFMAESVPVISNVHPTDGEVDVETAINITARITGGDSQFLNVSIWSNHTGNWVKYAGYWDGLENYNIFMVDFNDDGLWNYLDFSYWSSHQTSQSDGNFGFYHDDPVTHYWGMSEIETKYYWSINASGLGGWTNETYSFTTEDRRPPAISGVFPANGATNVPIHGVSPRALMIHYDHSKINSSIYTNASGTWTRVAGYPMPGLYEKFMADVDNDGNWSYLDLTEYNIAVGWQLYGTYGFWYSEPVTDNWGMNIPDTKYWWSINATDSVNWVNNTYSLTTILADEPPIVRLITPMNGSDNNLPLDLVVQVDISDISALYQSYYWTIECSNGDGTSNVGDTVGSKFLYLNILDYTERYTLWVNVTDLEFWTNETFWFETVKRETGLEYVNVTEFIPGSAISSDMFFLTVPSNITSNTVVNVPDSYEGKSWVFFRETKTVKTIKVYGISEGFKFQEIYSEALSFTVHGIENYKAVVIIPNPGFFQRSNWWFERLNDAKGIYNEYLIKGMVV